jgi:hypothetical protein
MRLLIVVAIAEFFVLGSLLIYTSARCSAVFFS